MTEPTELFDDLYLGLRAGGAMRKRRRGESLTSEEEAALGRWQRLSSWRKTIAVGPDGSVGGFLQLVPSPASEGYSLASMRRRNDTPNGLMEFLITETIAWARERHVTELSLNFAVFADFLQAGEDASRLTRAFRWVLLKADRLFQVERLHSFNRKFFPHWRRRYFCFERWADLPLAGLAYLHAESLLTPPGPWVKTPDLAAQ